MQRKGIMDNNITLRGLPIGPDVTRLISAYGVPAVGTVLEDSAVADVLKLDLSKKKDLARFKSVTRVWRDHLWETQTVWLSRRLSQTPDRFIVANAQQAFYEGARRAKTGHKIMVKGVSIMVGVDPLGLSEGNRKIQRDVAKMNASKLLAFMRPEATVGVST